MKTLDGILFSRMINAGAANLKAHVKEVNELNVFPIPDGDTGDNMLMTVMGGVCEAGEVSESLCETANRAAGGMLLSARGNSGVILSQFFEGIKNGFSGLRSADMKEMGEAFRLGVKQAYASVMSPTEGTILTVIREASEYACGQDTDAPEDFLEAFLDEARRSLERTPELLDVLKKAGVVDSGAAGLIYIAQGMRKAALGEDIGGSFAVSERERALDLDAFDENSVLEFGYCTELLLRLQHAKTDIASFDVKMITDFLNRIGESVVAVHNGSIVKLHVHTATPHKVLEFCQRYGEFLKVKIENMSLQHNNTVAIEKTPEKSRQKYGIVAVASGEGLKEAFRERGADVIVDGGQSMNPSAEDFMRAFGEANAEVIFVFPNNGNVVLAAQQAARLYEGADVRVIESRSIGAGYAALSMYDPNANDADTIESELTDAMEGVVTAEISHCIRNAEMGDTSVHTGDYIGFVGKELLSVNQNRLVTVCETIDRMNLSLYDICMIIRGKDVPEKEAARIEAYANGKYKGKELYLINGMQDVYDYILVME